MRNLLLILPLFISAPYLILYRGETSILSVASRKWEWFVVLPYIASLGLLLLNILLAGVPVFFSRKVRNSMVACASLLFAGAIGSACIGGGLFTALIIILLLHGIIVVNHFFTGQFFSGLLDKPLVIGAGVITIVLFLGVPPGQKYAQPSMSKALRVSRPHNIHEYLIKKFELKHRTRETLFRQINSRTEALEYQERTAEALMDIFGTLPARCPLNQKVTGSIEKGTYIIEKITFESRPEYLVTGNLYVPKAIEKPRPAVLFLCGHAFQGKSYEDYQAFCHYAALHGLIVLIIDPIGQGERHQYFNGNSPMFCRPTLEHIVIGEKLLLAGERLWTWMAWDGLRAIDYLQSRPEVSQDAITVIGNSGGGFQALITTALDCLDNAGKSRIRLSIISCSFGSYFQNLCNEIYLDTETLPVNITARNLEMEDMLVPYLPGEVVILAQKNDFNDIRAVREGVRRLRYIAELLDERSESPHLYEGDGEHGLDRDLREAAYTHICRCGELIPSDKGSDWETSPFVPCADEELRVFSNGRIDLHGSIKVEDILHNRIRDLKNHRSVANIHLNLDESFSILGVQKNVVDHTASSIIIDEKSHYYPHLRASEPVQIMNNPPLFQNWYPVETEAGILCNLFVVSSERRRTYLPRKRDVVLYLPDDSADKELSSWSCNGGDDILSACLSEFGDVYIFEARGMGRSAPRLGGLQSLSELESELFIASYSDALGIPILGRRIFDVISLIEVLHRRYGCESLNLIGRGKGAVIAVFCAAFNRLDIIKEIDLENLPDSYESIALGDPVSILRWGRSCAFPGILQMLDFEDLIALLRARGIAVHMGDGKEEMGEWVSYLDKYGTLPKYEDVIDKLP